ncbi:unnamed protein product [Cylicocyclus nassatus]|uniref:Uncharacterized protein n=1 Tax=Cylicocyclus nassatus TaxID=53992 RepID=A0AA36H760_CYLNA|nr:unnamed protein product [Cylicocyclus nassatus]
MKKGAKWGIGGGIILIIAIVAVVLAVVLPGRKKDKDEELPVMYFAMHLGDPAPARSQRISGQYQNLMEGECSLDLNVENTRKSIEGLGSNQKFAFIFYSNDVDTTSPMTAEEALERLKKVEAANESSYKQEQVAKAYTSRRNAKDLLVYFIPCDFSYSKDEDVKNFVTELQKSGVLKKSLIVSNTKPSQTVAQLYEMNDENVAGTDKNIIEKIIDFGRSTETTEQTQGTRTSRRSTGRPTTAPPATRYNCLFVGDLYNYGNDGESYAQEAELLSQVGYDIFDESRAKIGLWAYGHTDFPRNANASLSDMSRNHEELDKKLSKMKYANKSDPFTTKEAVEAINEMYDTQKQLNCLIFLTAQKRTSGLPRIAPKHLQFEKVVVVGLSDTHPKEIVPVENGVLISIPFYYVETDVRAIVEAIIGQKTTTILPTGSTKKPSTAPRCLFIGDMYNFGSNADAYIQEREFIATLGYDFFKEFRDPKLGFWAYGHLKPAYPDRPNLDKMSKNNDEFEDLLKDMEYYLRGTPTTTQRAIEIVNAMAEDDRANCLVFFAAPNNTASLPVLKPHSKIERIVAVGFADADLKRIAGEKGRAIKVPFYYNDEDVANVLNAIRGYVPTTTGLPTKPPTTTTTPAPRRKLNCLLVGDMYNYGSNVGSYDNEAELLSQVSYDVFVSPRVDPRLGLWAYGYTKYEPDVAKTLKRMVNDSKAFNNLLMEMEYATVATYKTTETAIKAINAMSEQQLDCLAFFTAQNNTKGLPKLEPKNKGIKSIVVVGLSGTKPDDIVPVGGKMISVPHYYLDEDVDKIVAAILDDKPWTTKRPTTTRPTTKKPTTPKPIDLKCLMVGDLFGFGASADDRYLDEAEFIDALGYDFFGSSGTKPMAGVWAYGYTTFPKSPDLSKITANRSVFRDELFKMQYQHRSDPLTTSNAIEVINKLGADSRVNCLVFFSTSNDTKSLPKLNPQNKGIERIVAVGFAGADLNDLVTDRGVAVSVPLRYLDEDIELVLKAILGKYVPTKSTTRSTSTTRRSTTRRSTTAAPKRKLNCMLVGDMYNYGSKVDSYDNEAELISQIGYDVFATRTVDAQLGLWAYGYTKFEPDVAKTLKRMTNNSNAFNDLLMEMEYAAVASYKNTEAAIKAINAMSEQQLNCLVFFTAQNNTKSLPKLEPKNKGINSLLVVGLSGTKPEDIVPGGGKMISVPHHYLDEDVDKIVKAILDDKPWTTKKPTTTKPTTRTTRRTTPTTRTSPPKRKLNCLIVGDMYNYGSKVDSYDNEAELISQIGYDVFATRTVDAQLGLWAYGYTKFEPDVAKTLKRMTNNSNAFNDLLMEMEYAAVASYKNTEAAIKAINAMNEYQLNCLVFFTAQNNTKGLPKLEPKNKDIDTIVAVGLSDTNPADIVPAGGKFISVPYHYLDEDVDKIVKAITDGKPWTTRKPSTTKPTTTTPKPLDLKCLMVGDLFGFGASADDRYLDEAEFIDALGYDFFGSSGAKPMAGVWAYGYTTFPKSPDLSKITANRSVFRDELFKMQYQHRSDPLTTSNAIEVINKLGADSRVNCLVFFSASNDTKSLPKLNPQNKGIERIVAVGFADADLSDLVTDRGVAVSVPLRFLDEHVELVLKAILGRYVPTKPTTRSTSTTRRSTTAAPKRKLNCLLVGDMYNYLSKVDSYDNEAELISQIGYDVFATRTVDSQLGLWAYGYTKFEPDVTKTLKRMTNDSNAFNDLLLKMEFAVVASHKNTEAAIKAINAMNENQLNCLVFFTAQNNTKDLPKLEPKNKDIDTIVAVGLSGTNPEDIVPAGGKFISVPYHYLDEDVDKIVKAITDGKPWTTRKPSTTTTTRKTTTPKPLDLKCLFVGDLYNFGSDEEKYLDEAEFISQLGYDFFESSELKKMAGLWAYGYTTFPKSPDLSSITADRRVFGEQLHEMLYHYVSDPSSTANAIETINRMSADSRMNCLVFFAGSNETDTLPEFNLISKQIVRLVAVGFDGANLSKLVSPQGIAVSVPRYYVEDDVKKVLKAIITGKTQSAVRYVNYEIPHQRHFPIRSFHERMMVPVN